MAFQSSRNGNRRCSFYRNRFPFPSVFDGYDEAFSLVAAASYRVSHGRALHYGLAMVFVPHGLDCKTTCFETGRYKPLSEDLTFLPRINSWQFSGLLHSGCNKLDNREAYQY